MTHGDVDPAFDVIVQALRSASPIMEWIGKIDKVYSDYSSACFVETGQRPDSITNPPQLGMLVLSLLDGLLDEDESILHE